MKKTRWLERSLLLANPYCLVLDEKAFVRALRALNVPRRSWPEQFVDTKAAACVHTLENDDGALCHIVAFRNKRYSKALIAGILAHEAVHVWQKTRDGIGERQPASEQEAYAIQNITEALVAEFYRQTKKKRSRK